MTDLIDPALLSKPEIRAAFPPTARKDILRPIIDYINMLNKGAKAQSSLETDLQAAIAQATTTLQKQIADSTNALSKRLDAVEAKPNIPQADAISDLPAANPVSLSVTNLLNIGVLSSNENEDRKIINKILALLRTHGWIKS